MLCLSSLFAECLGIHAFFGAFIAGCVVPRQGTHCFGAPLVVLLRLQCAPFSHALRFLFVAISFDCTRHLCSPPGRKDRVDCARVSAAALLCAIGSAHATVVVGHARALGRLCRRVSDCLRGQVHSCALQADSRSSAYITCKQIFFVHCLTFFFAICFLTVRCRSSWCLATLPRTGARASHSAF